MVMKKVKTSSKKLRICIEQKFGPYQSNAEAVAAKKRIKTKVPKSIFGTTLKTKQGLVILHKTNYIKSIDAPAAVVKQHLQAQIPGAKVTVTKA